MALPTFYIPSAASEHGAVHRDTVSHVQPVVAGTVVPFPTTEFVKPVKLGRIKSTKPVTCPKLADHLDKLRATPLPATINNSAKAMASIQQTLGNTQAGNCVIASTGHGEGVWSGNETGTPILSSDNEALSEYSRICGPGDNGCVITQVLDTWMQSGGGITIGGAKTFIDGYVAIDPSVPDQSRIATLVFGSHRIGFNVPAEWMNTSDGGVWDVPASMNFVGGHDVRIFGYGADGVYLATWGGKRIMTWAAYTNGQIVDEAYVELSPAWYSIASLAPNGINADTLKADLAAWKAGNVPVWNPSPVPPSPPPDPTQQLVATPSSGPAPLSVTFTPVPQTSGGAVSYGDGTPNGPVIDANHNPAHVYSSPGSYTPWLLDAGGNKLVTTQFPVQVSPPSPPPPATYTLTASPASGSAPLAVTFTLDPPLVGGDLAYGDGLASPTLAPHTYSAPGSYMAIMFDANRQEVAWAMITVGGSPVPPVPPSPPAPPPVPPITSDFTGTLAFVGGRLQTPSASSPFDDPVADDMAASRSDAGLMIRMATIRGLIRHKGMTRAQAIQVANTAAGGGLGNFLNWIVTHLPQILAIVNMILAMFGMPPIPIPPIPAPTPAGRRVRSYNNHRGG